MKVGPIPETLIERILLAAEAVPTPLLDSLQAMLLARSLMVASKVGVFNALATGPLTAAELSRRIGTDERATEKLLGALVGSGYLGHDNGRFRLAPVAKKWLVAGSAQSLHDNMLFRFMEWELLDRYEEFVRTGESVDIHQALEAEQWELYQRGMRSLANVSAPEVARKMPVPEAATAMLDIGGSHGYYSVCLCRRYPQLRATVLDLPQAALHAKPILAKENMGDRVVYRSGDALTEDLGEGTWDLVLVSSLVHHFDEVDNRELAQRISRSLRAAGTFAILEVVRPNFPGQSKQTGALMDVFFALASRSGTWSLEEMSDWQREAGLAPRTPIMLRSIPGAGIQAATKP